MDDPKWLRLVIIGLVLAALATGYFLLSGRLISDKVIKPASKVSQATPSPSLVATPTPSVLGQNAQTTPTTSPTPASAYNMIADRTQGGSQNVQTLPRTGFPLEVLAVFAVSVMITGWGLRKFPK